MNLSPHDIKELLVIALIDVVMIVAVWKGF